MKVYLVQTSTGDSWLNQWFRRKHEAKAASKKPESHMYQLDIDIRGDGFVNALNASGEHIMNLQELFRK